MKSFALLFAFISASIIPIQENPTIELVEFSGKIIDQDTGESIPGVNIWIEELKIGFASDIDGEFKIMLEPGTYEFQFTFVGYDLHQIEIEIPKEGLTSQTIQLKSSIVGLDEVVVTGYGIQRERRPLGYGVSDVAAESDATIMLRGVNSLPAAPPINEEYDKINENGFQFVQSKPLSTFSIDVDEASYSNIRRMIMDGYLPPADAVRIEELINYFNYNYAEPIDEHPFAIHSEIASAPWNSNHQIVQIGLKGEEIEREEMLPNNLVFLLDVSGSMNSPDKLDLLKKGFRLLVNELGEEDYVSILVYAGSSGMVLPPTSGFQKEKILQAIDNLRAGGSTAGAAGIKLAYETAKENYNENSNNRVILATDGDFNVGVSSDDELIELIEARRNDGIFLSVLGFGTGNIKDSKMEKIANHGNGNYYYIDNLLEAKKVLVSEMGGTLHTIAKDVKIQVEFNPSLVQAYRLIGYENRLLEDHEFNDDTKDAGELGSAHTVTALYEIVPVGIDFNPNQGDVDPLKYQTVVPNDQSNLDELMTVKFRYKKPDENRSKLITNVIMQQDLELEMSADLSFSSAVAMFGMLLRNSEHAGDSSFELVNEYARKGLMNDENGYRAEFLRISELADLLYQGNSSRD